MKKTSSIKGLGLFVVLVLVKDFYFLHTIYTHYILLSMIFNTTKTTTNTKAHNTSVLGCSIGCSFCVVFV
ncbi:protein of unknown function [Streptococcus thermophilus]|nr:protein of unknown function [Streptococcus thermophilus]CAD0161726.1 protein of unknown function [Streptococcus thermophilus]